MCKTKFLMEVPNGVFLLKKDFNQEGNWRSDRCYKFIYAVNGGMSYQTKRTQLTLDEQQFIMFNPQDEHKQIAVDKIKFLIELNPSFLNQVAKSLSPVHYGIQFASCTQRYPLITNWVKFVLDYFELEKDNKTESMELFLDHSFTQLALILVESAVGSHTQDINLNLYKKINPQLYKTILAMKENYKHPWTLEEMAHVSSLSKFQFAHYFKEIIGISPYSWLQIYRVIRSQEMLNRTNQTVLEIAIECGFSSVAVYNQLFKRLYGITPVSFRKMVSK